MVRRQGLPKISLHGLRHSFASVANSQGVPMFDISRTLGHSSMTVTSNIYTHLLTTRRPRPWPLWPEPSKKPEFYRHFTAPRF